MIILQSDRLRVEMPMPGVAPNTSLRFDRAGFISEVELDGMVRFCASEPKNLSHPTSGGRGLCNEYRFDVSPDLAVGEYFPKFGIGLIRKEEEGKYVFHRKYKDVVPFEVKVESSRDKAVFTTEPNLCQGYAMKTVKTVSVEDNRLIMTITAENTGEKTITMQEFCHNFISIDGMAIGSDYRLELPQCPDLGNERLRNRSGGKFGSMRGCGKGITFCEYSAIDTDYLIDVDQVEDRPFNWIMSHKGAKARVSCVEENKPAMIAIWAVDHMFSPEIIHGFELEPGNNHQWTRSWEFDARV